MEEEKPILPPDRAKPEERDFNSPEDLSRLQQDLAEKTILLREAVEKADRLQFKYERQSYYVRAFFSINRKLNGLRDRDALVENFLRLTLDSLGVEEGGVAFFNSREKQSSVKYRHFGKSAEWCSREELEVIKNNLAQIIKGRGLLSSEAQSLTEKELLALQIPTGSPQRGFWFSLSESTLGLVFLGKKLTALEYSLEEEAFLRNLTTNLAILLERAKDQERIQALHVDMEQRNSFIKKTVVDLNVSESRIKDLEKTKPQLRQAIKKELERSRRVAPLDLLLIIGLGMALGIIFNLVNPNGINPIPPYWFTKSPPQLDVQRAKLKFDSGKALLVDARPDHLYKQRHIKGAQNLPLAVFVFVYLMKFSHLDPERELIVYGRNISRHYDQEVALQLAARGHNQVKVLSGGLKSWQEKGFPVEP